MRQPQVLVIASLVVFACASSGSAQVLQPPPRPYRGLFGGGPPPDPNRTHQELTLTGSLLGGYDDNLVLPGAGDVFASSYPSSYLGSSDAAMRYSIGRLGRSVAIGGHGYMNAFSVIDVGPIYGGDQSLHAETNLGRRTNVQVDQAFAYAPLLSLGLFGPLQGTPGATENPDANPTNGLTESGSLTTRADMILSRDWTRKTKTTVGYSFNQQTVVGDVGFDTVSHTGSLGLQQALSRAWAIRVSYSHSNGEFAQKGDAAIPLRNQMGEAGLSYERQLSRTRKVSLSGGVGMLDAETVDAATGAPVEFSAPSGSGSVRFDFSRSWNVTADYRRTVSALQGVSPQAYIADAATIGVGGFVNRWLESVFSAGYSNGSAGYATDGQEAGRYDGYTGTVQVRFRLSRFWSALVSGTHYQYRLNAAASELLLISPQMDRNSVRVGLTWSLPLFGSYVGAPIDSGGN